MPFRKLDSNAVSSSSVADFEASFTVALSNTSVASGEAITAVVSVFTVGRSHVSNPQLQAGRPTVKVKGALIVG